MNQNKRKFKGVLSGFMATALTASFLPLPQAQASSFYDVNSYDWYATAAARWSAAGVIHGTGDNLFSPDVNVTRGQIAVMINNIMGYEVESQQLFSDLLDPSKYYYTPLRYLAAAGVVTGRDNGTMGSEDDVSRQEAALMLCKAFYLEGSEKTYTTFADNSQIESWAMPYVVTLNELGVLNGTPDNLVMPTGSLTRAEFATMLHALISSLTYSEGTSTNPNNITGTTIINTETSLKSTNVYGDLILAPGISYGDVYLEDLSITGNVYVRGGGVDSIYVTDVEFMQNLVVGRDKDPVRVVFGGGTTASTVAVQGDCILDNSDITSEGYVSAITIESGENVEIIGTYESLTNDSTGVNITIDGSISEIVMNASGTINGVTVAAGTSFDSNSIPGLDIEEPEITLTHNYGTAEDDTDNDPYAESEVMTIDFDSSTGEVVATIRVEDEEDCVLMAEGKNAITVYNPNDLASLNALELTVEKTEYSSYTEFEVSFTMSQNYTEIPLSVNFKDEYDAPEVNVIMNFNDLPKASAEYEINDLSFSTSSGTAKATIDLTEIKYCEPHYLEEYAITYDEDLYEDLEFSITKMDYDDDEATAYFNIEFNGEAVDSIDLTINMLKTDAEDEIPTVKSYLYHDEKESYSGKINYDYAELNASGLMEVKLDIEMASSLQLITGSKAVTVDAESDEPEYGYGLTFDYELTHEGDMSYYTVTFAPSATIEEVTFLVHVEDLDENIPTMYVGINEPRFTASTYSAINMNTRTYSRSQVTVEVAVDVEAIEDITGFEIDSSEPFTPIDSLGDTSSDYTVTKLEDGLYSIKFTPTTTENGDTTSVLTTMLRLNLTQSDDYIGLYPVSSSANLSNTHGTATDNTIPVANLPYASSASSTSFTKDYDDDTTVKFDYYTTVKFVTETNLEDLADGGGFFYYYGESYKTNSLQSYFALRLDDPTVNEDATSTPDEVSNYIESMYIGSVSSLALDGGGYSNSVVIYFESKPRVDPEDIRLNVAGVYADEVSGDLAEVYVLPIVTIDGNSASPAFTNSSTGWVKVEYKPTNTDQEYTFATESNDVQNFTQTGVSKTGYTITFQMKSSTQNSTGNSVTVAITMSEVVPTDYTPTLSSESTVKWSGGEIVDSEILSVPTVTFTPQGEGEATEDSTYNATLTIDETGKEYTVKSVSDSTNEITFAKNEDGKTWTATGITASTDLVLAIVLQYATEPTISDFSVSTGFGISVDTGLNTNTLVRTSQEVWTWELASYEDEVAVLKTDETLEITNNSGKTLYYSETDPSTSGWTGADSLTTSGDTTSLSIPVTTEPVTYYFSFNPDGTRAYALTTDVTANEYTKLVQTTQTVEEDTSVADIFRFTVLDTAAPIVESYTAMLKTAQDLDFTEFLIDVPQIVISTSSFIVNSGEHIEFAENCLNTGYNGDDNTFTIEIAVGAYITYMDDKYVANGSGTDAKNGARIIGLYSVENGGITDGTKLFQFTAAGFTGNLTPVLDDDEQA